MKAFFGTPGERAKEANAVQVMISGRRGSGNLFWINLLFKFGRSENYVNFINS